MDLQPSQATFADGFSLCEEEEPTRKIITNVVQVWWDGVRSATEVQVVGEVKFVAQELRLGGQHVSERAERVLQVTHRASDLDLVVYAAPFRVIVRLALTPRLLPVQIDQPRPRIRLVILRPLRFRVIVDCRRNLAHLFTGVPYLEDHVEDLSIDLPWCRTKDIQASVDKLQVSLVGGVFEVALLFLRVFEAHRRS